jgi:hypothetical protein
VFNSAYFGGDVARSAKGTAGFWTAPKAAAKTDSVKKAM